MSFADGITVMGSGLNQKIRESLIECSLNGSTGSVTQLSMTFADQYWNLLRSGFIAVGMRVEIAEFRFLVARISTGDSVGVENFKVECRPQVVRALKNRQGPRVMKNVSPSQFVESECNAVGAGVIAQPSARVTQVARDVPQKGAQEVQVPPSSWSTFSRLAGDLGYILFESAGVIFFGKPTWLLDNAGLGTIPVDYKQATNDALKVRSIPQCSVSEDSTDITCSVNMRMDSASEVRPGKRLQLRGVPTFDGAYLVSSFDVDMLGSTQMAQIEGITTGGVGTATTIGNTRQNTRLANDFIYWVQAQVGDRYVIGTTVNLENLDPNEFDGSELIRWGASQIGVFMPANPDDQMSYITDNGFEQPVADALALRGAVLWNPGHTAISLGGGRVIEGQNGAVAIISGVTASRYAKGGKLPGVLY